jgi:tetratricopeptide (TPR) repeat protein
MRPGILAAPALALALALALGSLLVAGSWFGEGLARADTPRPLWARLSEPSVSEQDALHIEARRALLRLPPEETDLAAFAELRRKDQVRIVISKIARLQSRTTQLQFDLGELYEEASLHRFAIGALTVALKTPEGLAHPGAEDAWLALAYAYAKSDSVAAEKEAYEHYLRTATNPRSRATAALNLAEAEMRLGNLSEAIAGYRGALEQSTTLAFSQETAALAVWGLAVALDRNGESRAAQLEASRALRLDQNMFLITESENVFFEPAYERLWYIGMGLDAVARDSTDAETRISALQRSAAVWEAYIAQASTERETWAARASAHLQSTKRLLTKAATAR